MRLLKKTDEEYIFLWKISKADQKKKAPSANADGASF
jgi:hypothetical protein